MLAVVAPLASRPIKVALVIDAVSLGTTKSSPVSISLDGVPVGAESGRLAAAILPSVFPVLKKKGLALPGAARPATSVVASATRTTILSTMEGLPCTNEALSPACTRAHAPVSFVTDQKEGLEKVSARRWLCCPSLHVARLRQAYIGQ